MARILPRQIGQDGEVGYGLAELSQSIFASLGLPELDNSLNLPSNQRACLLLVDGMGAKSLAQYAHEFPIFASALKQSELVSHFPTTTVTNLTSLGTGVLPGAHGMLGYTVRVPNSGTPGRLLNALKWDERVDPLYWQKVPTLFERAQSAGITVSNVAERRYEGSAFTQAALRGAKYLGANRIDEMVEAVRQSLQAPRAFTYVYINALDHAGHNDGVGSEKWLTALGQVAELIEKLANSLSSDVQLLVTADHGMVNVGEKVILGRDNPLMENITLVGGEPRARHMYVEDGSLEECVARWREFLQNRAQVMTKSEIIESGLFGAEISPESHDRMGDFVAIAEESVILIDPNRIPQESSMVGHHGGLTEVERSIPLLSYL
jgi:predicted AlkP superfamily pyrophosphatase or phosphodiesterase